MIQAFRAGQLIDGRGGNPIKNAVLLVKDKKIIAAGSAGEIQIPEGAIVTDALGKTLMPGLIDCHVHVMMCGASLEQELFTPKAVLYYQAAENLKRTLRAGFTTVRDAGGADAGIRAALEMGLITGPRLVVSGRIGQTGGMFESYFPSGAQIVNEDSWRICDGVDEVRKIVRRILREGVNFVKIFATGGVVSAQGSPFTAEWSPQELAVIVEEAHRHGAGVMAHAEGNEGIKNALRAGVTSIEHGNVLDQEAIDLFLEKDIFLVPTLHVNRVLENMGENAGLSEVSKQKEKRLTEVGQGNVRRAHAAGVKIALGTDSFITGMHGKNAAELPLMMEKGGLSAMEAIVAGTRNAAECCFLGDQVGTLEAGKLADFLLVDGDPLAEITILQAVERITVYKEGILTA